MFRDSSAVNQPVTPADYDYLPESIKMVYSPSQYLWLSDYDKAKLIENECTPEFEA